MSMAGVAAGTQRCVYDITFLCSGVNLTYDLIVIDRCSVPVSRGLAVAPVPVAVARFRARSAVPPSLWCFVPSRSAACSPSVEARWLPFVGFRQVRSVSVMFAYRVHDGRKRIRPNPPPQYPPPRVPGLRDLHLYVSPPRDHLSGLSSPVRDDGMPVGRVLFPPSQLSQWYSDACRAPKYRHRRIYGDSECGLGLHLPLCLVPGLPLADRPIARTRSSPAGPARARSRGARFLSC